MHIVERCCIAFRHSPWLDQMAWLWDRLRPLYERAVALFGRNGLSRTINGTDRILISPRFRGVTETYETEVWNHLMAQVQPGNLVVDIGAFIGFYTIALAKRVGSSGKVIAFEPDPINFATLKTHVELNRVSDRVELIQAAVGDEDGFVPFQTGRASESHISQVPGNDTQMIRCVRLDTIFPNRKLDILKIDVEGYEEEVLKGALNLLQDNRRSPRAIYIEVHPYAWPGIGASSESLIALLISCNYQVVTLDGKRVEHIERYGEILAHRCSENSFLLSPP
jgi:FkbM family methyltransferase